MLKSLKRKVLKANLALPRFGLVLFTWGNASEVDPGRQYVVIKPSGVDYADMTADMMCVVSLESGEVVEGGLRPSSDLETHLEIYRAFTSVSGVVHTHSSYAAAFAQAGEDIPCYGTTHADYFYGTIPCARQLRPDEIENQYERNTGLVVVETFETRDLDPAATPAVLVGGHGPFTWGSSAMDAAKNAAYLEEVAKIAYFTRQLGHNGLSEAPKALMDKHYFRKHGANAYYGQGTKKKEEFDNFIIES